MSLKQKSFFEPVVVCAMVAVAFFVYRASFAQQPSQQASTLFQRIATALEAYAVDNNGNYPPDGYPPGSTESFPFILPTVLTTPIPYLTAEDMIDPFAINNSITNQIRYLNIEEQYKEVPKIQAIYMSLHGSWLIWSGYFASPNPKSGLYFDPVPYDATNGTLSEGTIFRSQRMNSETGVNN